MSLIHWEPFREVDNLQKEMNRLFDQFIALPRTGSLNNVMGSPFVPSAELAETDEAFSLKLEVPGLKPEDLDIQVTADSVSIRGERRSESTSEADGYTRSEFRYGKFERVIPLPAQVQNTDVKAEYQDGILLLSLPKAEEEKNKVIKIEVNPA